MLIAEFSRKGEEIEIENELWQYDYGQRLQIKGLDLPETFEVHFAWKDSEKAKVVIGSTVNGISTVDIPNVALEQRRTITAYIYLSDTTEGETVNTIVLSVNKRKAPENFETPEDVDLFHHTLAATAEYQRQAKESEKQAAVRSADAEAWAHGREDHPEQAFGLILNVWLGLGMWDYSNMPGNILGQICPQFMVLWFFLSAIGIFLDDLIRWRIFGEEKPHYHLFKKRKGDK